MENKRKKKRSFVVCAFRIFYDSVIAAKIDTQLRYQESNQITRHTCIHNERFFHSPLRYQQQKKKILYRDLIALVY